MRDRIKWVLIGLGFTFGLQAIISLLFTGLAYGAANSVTFAGQDLVLVVALGLVIGTFLIGGFVVGCISEEIRLLDSLMVALTSIALSFVVYLGLPQGNKAQFVTGYLLSDPARTGLFVFLGTAAALIGAYWGWHVNVPHERVLDRIALLIALMAAAVGPFVLLIVGSADSTSPGQSNRPWSFIAAGLVFMLLIVGVGVFMFSRESKRSSDYEHEISINPDHQRPTTTGPTTVGGVM